MANDAPYMYSYSAVKDDDRFPATTFDPKAITRASWEKPKPKPKRKGPLVSVNRHPDAQAVLNGRTNFRNMGRKTKAAIKTFRVIQLVLRVFELIAAAGLLVLFILINNFMGPTAWIMRITLAVVIVHCTYSVFHNFRPASARTPGSSAAYHFFASMSDLCVLPLYAYGVYTTRNQGEQWGTIISDEKMLDYFVPAVFYSLIGAGGLHLVSLCISLWLAIMFRRITAMPPDMNPLESNLTSRAHKRNKSSIATTSTAYSDSPEKRLSTLSEGSILEGLERRSMPFLHTRQNSETSTLHSRSNRDSRLDLPSRQYQIQPGNRNSLPAQPPPPPPHTSRPTSLYSLPLENQMSSGTVTSYRVVGSATNAPAVPQPRSAKFTETWDMTPSLVERTRAKTYNALQGAPNDSDPESDTDENYRTSLGGSTLHPSPLGSNPAASKKGGAFSRLRASVMGNNHKASKAQERDITERQRDSSIQLDSGFVSKRYGDLSPGTLPVPLGNGGDGNRNRHVSTGNDFSGDMGRMRHVSGRQAEEGMAGGDGWR